MRFFSENGADGPVHSESRPVFGDDRRHVAVITTTIHVPHFLGRMLKNAERYGHAERLTVIVVGDRKTPQDTREYLSQLDRQYAADIVYLDIAEQKRLMRRWPALDLFVRYDCIQRRNVGLLRAALDRADVIISVDDDNLVADDDFIGHHLIVGRTVELPVVSRSGGWWNVCERLVADPPRRFYHRGFPKSQQDWVSDDYQVEMATVRVVANAGLWLRVPDVDATTHLDEPINVVSMLPIAGHRTCVLAFGCWSPMNTQNTAFDARLLPVLYLPVMHDWMRGYRVTRMDDIWMSYFLRTLADPRGDSVTCGPPLLRQERNPHDFVSDLSRELGGYILTEKLVGYLRSFRCREVDYLEAYLDLIYHLRDCWEADETLERPEREYFRQLTLGMAAWYGAMSEVVA